MGRAFLFGGVLLFGAVTVFTEAFVATNTRRMSAMSRASSALGVKSRKILRRNQSLHR